LPSLEARTVAVAFAPDGKSLATLSVDRKVAYPRSDVIFSWLTLHVRDPRSGKVLVTIPKLPPGTHQLAYSPDGKLLAARNGRETYDGTVIVWDTQTGKELKVFRAGCFDISPDSRSIVAFANDGHVRMWDLASGQELRDFGRTGNSLHSVAFSPDGKRVAVGGNLTSGGDEWQVRIYRAATGEVVWKTTAHEQGVRAVAFSPDGRLLATGSEDTTALIWKVP
jgi:WD40 repeat protein